MPGLFSGIKGYKPALSRLMAWVDTCFQQGLAGAPVSCAHCGGTLLFRIEEDSSGTHLWAHCGACGRGHHATLGGRLLALPAGRRFWRAHPRLRPLPEVAVEAAGVPAIVTRYESVTEHARFEVVCTRATCTVLSIHGAPPA
jgi:hypothetical protein